MKEKQIKKMILISELSKIDSCSPKIADLASKLNIANSTIHYNIKKLEEQSKILGYKAVFNYKKVKRGFCAFALMKLDGKYYNDMDSWNKFGKMLASNEDVESVDVVTGEWEFIVKIRAKDQDDYWVKLQNVIKDVPIIKVNSMISIRQLKSEYTLIPESDITE